MPVPINSRNGGNLPKVLAILLLIVAGITGLTFLINRYFISPTLTLKQPVTILVVGEDMPQTTGGFPQMDTLVLALINPKKSKVSLLSIPGASQAGPLQTETSISDAGGKQGILKAQQLISELTGIKIDHYMELDFNGFRQLVDLLDGVEVDVAQSVRYTNKYGQPIAEITPGRQILNGEQALLYVRYLDQKGEADRIARQQIIFKAILTKAAQPGNIMNAVKINGAMKKYLKTDLSLKEVLQLMAFAKSIDLHRDLAVYMLPGTAGETYWKPDYPAVRRLMRQLSQVNHK
jgi:LCP family protein required for cell wall assembly